MSWDNSEFASGAASGAAAGSFAGPVGMAIGGAIGGLTGGLFGGKAKPSQSELFNEKMAAYASNLFDQGPAQWFGDKTVGLTDAQHATLGQVDAFTGAGGMAPSIQNALYQSGMGAQAGGQQAQNYYRDVLRDGYEQSAVDMGKVAQYADNPYLNDMITATQRGGFRDLYENQLPAERARAAASGRTLSGRSQVQEGVLKRGAEDRAADIAAGMRGQAYDTGLGMAQREAEYNSQMRAQQQGAAAANLASLAQTGLGNMGQAYNFGYGNLQNRMAGQAMTQADLQQQRQDRVDAFEHEQNKGWDLLANARGNQFASPEYRPNSVSRGLQMAGQAGLGWMQSGQDAWAPDWFSNTDKSRSGLISEVG